MGPSAVTAKPASGPLFPSLSVPPLFPLSLSLSKINKHLKKITSLKYNMVAGHHLILYVGSAFGVNILQVTFLLQNIKRLNVFFSKHLPGAPGWFNQESM